jgi:hypothetical protein
MCGSKETPRPVGEWQGRKGQAKAVIIGSSDAARGFETEKCGAFFPSGLMKIFKWTAKSVRPRQHFLPVGNVVYTATTLEMKYQIVSIGLQLFSLTILAT